MSEQMSRSLRRKQSFILRHRTFFIVLTSILTVILLGISITSTIIVKHFDDQTAMLKIANMNKDIEQSLTIQDANGQNLVENEKIIKYKQSKIGKDQNISQLYLDTIVATEDHSFYTRFTKGYSIKGTLGAVASQVKSKITKKQAGRGGSTIEQQLAKMIVFGEANDNSVGDKIVQIIDGHKLAQNYSRNQILASYINQLHLTPSTIGVKAASMQLFKNDLTDTSKTDPKNVAQIAFMAGLGQSPSTYENMFDKYGKSRTKTILGIMVSNKLISEKVYKDTLNYVNSKEFTLQSSVSSQTPDSYKSYISKTKSEIADMNLPSNSVITVKTWTTKEILDQMYQINKGQVPSNPSIPLNYIEHPESLTAISAVDTKTGHILALSTNSDNPQTPYVGQRSSGSSIKPLLDYAPALEYGQITPYSKMRGSSFTTQGWNVVNYGGANYGSINASKALGMSLNTAAVQAFEYTTQSQKESIMSPLGLSKYNADPNGYNVVRSIDYPTNTLAMASAYSAIGNDGVRIEPTTIDTINVDGKEIKKSDSESQRSMSSSTAKDLVQMLQNVTEPGGSEPYAAPQYIGLKGGTYAVKSGLSNYESSVPGSETKSPDAWMNLTSPSISVSAWIGSPSYTDSRFGVTSAPASAENSARVYLLNNAVRTLMQGRDNGSFTWSGQVMHNTKEKSNVPSLSKINDQSLKSFKPKNPEITKDRQKSYDDMQNQVNSQQDRVNATYTGQ